MRYLSLTRYLLSLAAALLAVGVCAPRAQASFILNKPSALGLNNGLVGWWTFDGKDVSGVQAYDRSGNGNRGILTSGPVQTIGKIGQGLSFDGVDDYLIVKNESNQVIPAGNAAFSISLWFRADAFGSVVLSIMSNEIFSTSGFRFGIEGGIEISCGVGNGKLSFWSNESGGDICMVASSSLNRGQWYHTVVVYTGNSAQMFIDGASAVSDASGTIISNTNDISIAGAIGGKLPFDGLIDDVRIYNRALSSDEIKRLYNMGGTVKLNSTATSLTNGLAGWWTFDGKDMAGNYAFDKSGNGNRGTLTGTNGVPVRTLGKIGQGMQFDGVDDYLDTLSTNGVDNLSKLTYSVWIKPSIPTNGVARSIISKNGSDKTLIFYGDCCGDNKIRGIVQTDATRADTTTANNTIIPGNWYHVVMTYDDSTDRKIYMYINGSLAASPTQIAETGTINTEIGSTYQFARPEFAVARYTGPCMTIHQEDTRWVWEACLDARGVVRSDSHTARIFVGKGRPRR